MPRRLGRPRTTTTSRTAQRRDAQKIADEAARYFHGGTDLDFYGVIQGQYVGLPTQEPDPGFESCLAEL